MEPGWYQAEGDPPGTQRYWDGSAWQGGPQPSVGAGGSGFDQITPQYDGVASQHYPEESQATMAIILSILGLILCCGLVSPVGWIMGQRELDAIAAGRRDPANRGTANGAKIIGIIGTVVLACAVVFFGLGFLGLLAG